MGVGGFGFVYDLIRFVFRGFARVVFRFRFVSYGIFRVGAFFSRFLGGSSFY